MPYKIYIDESGNHQYYQVENVNYRYLSLLGTIVSDNEHVALTNRFNTVKESVWGERYREVYFHRDDMINKKKQFVKFLDSDIRNAFDQSLLSCIGATSFKIVCVVIDKKNHLNRYAYPQHPYHYCTGALMGRYVGLLRRWGDVGAVFAESRGKQEDDLLQVSFGRFYDNGDDYFEPKIVQRHISSRDIQFFTKSANVAGLQLSDMFANPIKRYALVFKGLEEQNIVGFTEQMVNIAKTKFNRRFSDSQIEGYGIAYLSCQK